VRISIGSSILALCGLFAPTANAAPVTYLFDTVTAVTMHSSLPSITGVLRNGTDPVTVSFRDNTNVGFRFVVNRCVPVFLTMLDKPGRYSLELIVDPAELNVQLVSCSLQVRS
jgi:hypothetical protein